MANEVKAPRWLSGGVIALAFAWLLYLGVMAGGAYYAFLVPVTEQQPETIAEQNRASPGESAPATPQEPMGADDTAEVPAATALQEAAELSPPPPEPLAEGAEEPAEQAIEEPASGPPAEPAGAQAEAGEAAAPPEAAPPATASATDDRPAWQRFARPLEEGERRPRLAVVITGLGLSSAATKAAIQRLPPEVSLSFSPYARGLDEWLALARAKGHEVLLDLPMEPANFPADDPGPRALLTSLDEAQNLERLDWVLGRGSGYVGLVSSMGARFTLSPEHLRPVVERLKEEGLLLLDSSTTDGSLAGPIAAEVGLPVAVNDRALDAQQASSVAIDANLIYVEHRALAEGAAVAIGQPFPVTIDRLVAWGDELSHRGIALVPVTAIVGKQYIRPLASDSETGTSPPVAAPAAPQATEPAR